MSTINFEYIISCRVEYVFIIQSFMISLTHMKTHLTAFNTIQLERSVYDQGTPSGSHIPIDKSIYNKIKVNIKIHRLRKWHYETHLFSRS